MVGVDEIIIYLIRTKQNDPRQTYLDIFAPENLQKESLWQEIITSIKQYGKAEIKNITKNIYAAFSCLWNLKSTITCKCGGVALFLTSVYFVIRKLILLFSYSFHVPCIILSSVYFYMYVLCFPFFLIDHNQKQVLLIKWVILFLKLKNIFFCSFQLFEKVIFTTLFWRWSTLSNSTLKIAALFPRCLTLLISTLK